MKVLNYTTVERASRPVRILQFGEGNFLRAFVDWMVDIANERGVMNTSVAVVPPRFRENASIGRLRAQHGLYHVVLEGIRNGRPERASRLIVCISEVMVPETQPERYEAIITSPDLRFIISNTTEAGIRYEKDDVLSEIPATFPGKITGLLWRRWKHFNGDADKGLIFLCCELIEDNSTTLREFINRHAVVAGLPQAFIDWVNGSCMFADTLVDRIVPGFPADNIDEVKAELQFDDNCVVEGGAVSPLGNRGRAMGADSRGVPPRQGRSQCAIYAGNQDFPRQEGTYSQWLAYRNGACGASAGMPDRRRRCRQ